MLRASEISVLLLLLAHQGYCVGTKSATSKWSQSFEWRQKLWQDLRRISDPVTPPLLQGQTEKDLRINLTISEMKMFEVEIDENDAFVDMNLGVVIEWFAPALKWPPEVYGNITHGSLFNFPTSYIKTNLAVDGGDSMRLDYTGKISWPGDARFPVDCYVSRWFPNVRLHCELELKFLNGVGNLLEFGCLLEPIFIPRPISTQWELREFTCAPNARDSSKLLIFEVQRVTDTRAHEMLVLLALSFMHAFVPTELPERAVLSGASLVSVFVFLLSPMCQSDPWWQTFSAFWSRLLCSHVLLTVLRLAPLKLSGPPEKVLTSFGRNTLMAMPTSAQEMLIFAGNKWKGFEKVLVTLYFPVHAEDSAAVRREIRLRLSSMLYHAIELCVLISY